MRERGERSERVRGERSFRWSARGFKNGGKTVSGGCYEDLKRVAHTFYFTNFPEDLIEKDMWVFFNRFGRTVDLFICKRRNSKGKRFGFVRFRKEGFLSSLQRKLDEAWIGSYKIITRYQSEYPVKKSTAFAVGNPRSHLAERKEYAVRDPSKSYAAAVKSKIEVPASKVVTDQVHRSPSKTTAVIENCSLEFFSSTTESQWLDRCVLGVLKSLDTLYGLANLLRESGFENCLVKSLGGLNIIIECETVCARNRMLLNDGFLGEWLQWIGPWSLDFHNISRCVWLNCRGVPLNVWNWNTFQSIGSIFGEVLEVDASTEARLNLEIGKVRVRVSHGDRISRKLLIKVNDVATWIHVDEACHSLQVHEECSSSCSSSESGNLDDDFKYDSDDNPTDSDIEKRSIFENLQNNIELALDSVVPPSNDEANCPEQVLSPKITRHDPFKENTSSDHVEDSVSNSACCKSDDLLETTQAPRANSSVSCVPGTQNLDTLKSIKVHEVHHVAHVDEDSNNKMVQVDSPALPIGQQTNSVHKKEKHINDIYGFDCETLSKKLVSTSKRRKKCNILRPRESGVFSLHSRDERVTDVSISDSNIRNMTNLVRKWLTQHSEGKSESEKTSELGRILGIEWKELKEVGSS